ncbi:MAG TPA: hypothetical protein VK787_10380 [Puia sp.]|jgi:hypothetical protein|nr:hypothetical protein [Puia sp.]
MSTPFTIRITKEILARAKNCGLKQEQFIGDNCAIALALQDIFPDVFVTGDHIHPFGFDQQSVSDMKITLPAIARDFIKVFDSLVQIPRVRLRLPEFAFDISIPDKILDQINIDEIHHIETVQTPF